MHSVNVQRKQQKADSMLSVNKKSFDQSEKKESYK